MGTHDGKAKEGMGFTDSSELRVGSCHARHVEEGQERFIGNSSDHHLDGVGRVDDIVECLENGRNHCLAGDWTGRVGLTEVGTRVCAA